MYIHVPVQPQVPASPKAKELGAKIAELVRILRQEDPSISRTEVEQGISLAQAELRQEMGGRSAAAPLLMAGLAVLFGAGLLAYFLMRGGGGRESVVFIVLGVTVGLALIALLAVAIRKAKG